MEITKKEFGDIVTPDKCIIKDWNIDVSYSHTIHLTISFDGDKVYIANPLVSHPLIWRNIKNKNTFDLRYWVKENLITMWTKGDVITNIKRLKQAFEANKIDNQTKIDIDINTVQFVFIQLKDYTEYIVKCNISEINDSQTIIDNEDLRILHLLSPTKRKLIEEYMSIKEEKHNYYLTSQRAWIRKYGYIDPALYHLLAYEE